MAEIKKFKLFLVPCLTLIIGFGSILVTIFTKRDITIGENFDNVLLNSNFVAFTISRWLSAIVISISIISIIKIIMRGSITNSGSTIWISYIIFFITNILIASFISNFQNFDIRFFYAPIVLTAVFVTKSRSNEQLLKATKIVLLAYIYGSLLAAVITPKYAMMGQYSSFLPGINFRLFGVAPHANSLGPLSAVYIVIEMMQPSQSKIRLINLIAAIAVLLLAQSKTAWIFFLLAGLCYFLKKTGLLLFPDNTEKSIFNRNTLYALGIAFVLGVIALVFGFGDLGRKETVTDLSTLSGRTEIWTITLNEWQKNPLFGYGLNLWDEKFRARNKMFYVGHAHNQFIHTLGSSGLVGLIGLLIYLRTLTIAAIKTAKRNPVPLILLCMILIDCVSEVPLHDNLLLDIFFLFHILLFSHLIQDARQQAKNIKIFVQPRLIKLT